MTKKIFNPRQVWNAILDQGQDITIEAVTSKEVNPFALLASLADIESAFGIILGPRYEKVFDVGGKYYNKKAWATFGKEACYSWSIYQVMGTSLYEIGMKPPTIPSKLEDDASLACEWCIRYLNTRLKDAQTLKQVADGYNSGSFHDAFVPDVYCNKVIKAYNKRLAQLQKYWQSGDESILNS